MAIPEERPIENKTFSAEACLALQKNLFLVCHCFMRFPYSVNQQISNKPILTLPQVQSGTMKIRRMSKPCRCSATRFFVRNGLRGRKKQQMSGSPVRTARISRMIVPTLLLTVGLPCTGCWQHDCRQAKKCPKIHSPHTVGSCRKPLPEQHPQ